MSRGHRVPAIANRLLVNRSFDSAWFTDASYANMFVKNMLLSRAVRNIMARCSRYSAKAGGSNRNEPPQTLPTFRTPRVFLNHLPYKTLVSTWSYVPPATGLQAKYNLLAGSDKRQ